MMEVMLIQVYLEMQLIILINSLKDIHQNQMIHHLLIQHMHHLPMQTLEVIILQEIHL